MAYIGLKYIFPTALLKKCNKICAHFNWKNTL